jgi:hypothetical protein
MSESSSETPRLNPDDGLEQRLRGLTPRPPAIDRDELMFAAGRAAAGRSLSVWRGVAAASLCLALGLGAFAGLRPGSQVVERIVYVPAPVEQPTARPTPDETPTAAPAPAMGRLADAAWSLQRRVLAEGIDALPPPPPVPMSRLSLRELTN